MVFPRARWQRAVPEDQGMLPGPIEEMGALMKKSRANGVLIRNGYLVAEWNFKGPAEEKTDVQSCGKSITSLVLGLALDEGLITSLDVRVKQAWPAFNVGPHTEEITFRHLITMTSGIATKLHAVNFPNPDNMKPGVEHHYQNDQPHEVAKALTYLYGRELQKVLQERVLDVIGGDVIWPRHGTVQTTDGRSVPVNMGYGCSRWAAHDLARVGHLYLNRGNWNGKQVLSEAYVKESFTAVPVKICEYKRKSRWHGETAAERAKILATLRYGLAWWSRTFYNPDTWYMSGNGSQFCLIIPRYNIVMVKINDYRVRPWTNHPAYHALIMKSLGESE